jgi:8-amino-3,8-dideoxy-alpha-D-manno-octulosonate transaminase
MLKEVQCQPYYKYTTEELMELVDLFGISAEGQEKIKDILSKESKPPLACLFRYYNKNSRVDRLEQEFKKAIGVEYALAVNSGTSALIAALVAAGVGPGDEVIVPGYTFFASVSAIVVAKAIPVIVDIDESLTLSPEAVLKAITPRTKAIIVVHMLGLPAKMDQLRKIADEHKLVLIEDVAQATGGSFKGKKLGAWGHLGCFSLDAYKVIGTGEGGMITTDNEWLYTRAQSYHDTAACWRPNRYDRERREGELFCGENYRMSEMAGAIGLAQIKKLDWINSSTRKAYKQLRAETKLPAHIKWVEPNDMDGLCGYHAPLLFETHALAEKVIKAGIGIGGLAGGGVQGARDWHVYWYWEHILEQKTATKEGCPFKCPFVKSMPAYSADMCLKTKDIMLRMGTIGLVPTATLEYVSYLAAKLSSQLSELVK